MSWGFAAPLADIAPGEHGRDGEDRNGIGKGFPERGQDIGKAGTGYDKADTGSAGRTREAIGHESRALLMPWQDHRDPGVPQFAEQFRVVHAGNGEHAVHTVGRQAQDQAPGEG